MARRIAQATRSCAACGGVPPENLTAVAAFCKQQLAAAGHPASLVYVNECRPSFAKFSGLLPAGLDVISFVRTPHAGTIVWVQPTLIHHGRTSVRDEVPACEAAA